MGMNQQALVSSLTYIESWLRFQAERSELPGFAVAIAHQGKLVFNHAYGYANLEKKEKLTPHHLFRIASHSKTITATAILQLAEDGKLALDDTVMHHLPWLEEHTDKRIQQVTLRQLLCHRAGLIRDGLDCDFWQVLRAFPTREELQKSILAAELVLEPNTKMKYSNFGFSVLGLVVEAASGQPYNDYVTRRIVAPLGLKDMGPEYTPAIKSKLATGYTPLSSGRRRVPVTKAVPTNAMSPATGFYATPQDVCAYFSALFPGTGKLLSDESKKEMQRQQSWIENTQARYEYGLGVEIQHPDNKRVFGHSGGFPGFVTKTICEPETKLVITVMTNSCDMQAHRMAMGVFKTIRFFQKNTGTPTHRAHHFEGRYMNLYDVYDIVAAGNRIVCAIPGSWSPLSNPDELTYVDSKTLRLTKTIGFNPDQELIHFNKDGSIRFTGLSMWPEAVYTRKLARITSIDL